MILTVCLSGYSLSLNTFAKNNLVNSIEYTTNKPIDDFALNKNSVKVINQFELDSINSSNAKYIIIDGDMLENPTANTIVKKAFSNGTKIFIKDISLDRNFIRQYFELPQKNYSSKKIIPEKQDTNPNTIVDVSTFKSVGMLVYRDMRGVNLTDLKVENFNNENDVLDSIEYVFNYDYLKLVLNEELEKENLFKISKIYAAYESSWSYVDVDTSTYSTDRGVITTSLRIKKNDGNPSSNDQYLFYIPYIVDVDMNGSYVVDETEIEVMGKENSLICDYGPTDTNNNTITSVSFSLPYSVSVEFAPGDKIIIDKLEGGLNSKNLKLKFDLKTGLLGSDGYSTGLRSESHIESYQTSASFEGYGSFYVVTRVDTGYGYIYPINYYNGEADYVSGS